MDTMLIDVQETDLNLVLNACLYGLALLTGVSIIPWRLRDGRNRWSLWLPLAAVLAYATYEFTMPSRWDIRIDLLLIWPLLLIIVGAWLVRLVALRRRR
jgi:hypothetical protein